MLRKLLLAALAALSISLSMVALDSTAAGASSYALPYGGGDCGTLAGPVLTQETTYYMLVYRVNSGSWQYSNWMATVRTANYEWVGHWRAQQTNFFVTPDLAPGSTVDRWAYVYTASGGGRWVNLGSCSQGGIVYG